MKAFVFVVLALVASSQARSAELQKAIGGRAATLGENPWVVHLRVAVSTSGYLESCVGSLVSDQWVLTSARCVENARFIWIRYGAVDVPNPELVTETSAVTLHPDWNANFGANDIALVSINRVVEATANISPISLGDSAPETAQLCGYGASDSDANVAGSRLRCVEVAVRASGDNLAISSEAAGGATKFDIGAPLVSNGVQVGLLTNQFGVSIRPARYLAWINSVTGLDLRAAVDASRVIVADDSV